ncbi:coat protein [Clostridium sporogenes]
MAVTKLKDMVIPENFTKYTSERATEKNVFFRSGIVAPNPQLAELLEVGGKTIVMPFVKPLGGDSEIPSEDGDISLNNINTSNDMARRQFRVKAWGENQLASILSGTNVMDDIGDATAQYWSTEYTKMLISTCKGVFAKLTDHVNDISGKTGNASLFNASDAIDTKFILGDSADNIGALAVNSAVYAYMLKQDQITTVPSSDGKGSITVYKPLMAKVIVDDAIPYDNTTKICSMYMYGKGAFGFVENNKGIVPAEIGRNKLRGMGENFLVTRKQFVLHPLGVQWNEASPSPVSPTNSDLENKARYNAVKEKKNIYLAEFRFKIA